MCGIVGYIGNKNVFPLLLNGLKRLEYRGYDSAGIAILMKENDTKNSSKKFKITIAKQAGKIAELEKLINDTDIDGCVGIGHTRWATHGAPTQINAHPHMDCKSKIAVVHNGIIENYAEIKEELILKGHNFMSETDTEVIPHILEEFDNGDLLIAMQKLLKRIKG